MCFSEPPVINMLLNLAERQELELKLTLTQHVVSIFRLEKENNIVYGFQRDVFGELSRIRKLPIIIITLDFQLCIV